jgi:hypothetical protein
LYLPACSFRFSGEKRGIAVCGNETLIVILRRFGSVGRNAVRGCAAALKKETWNPCGLFKNTSVEPIIA